MRHYLGFLKGRSKSTSTISSYKTDLELLEKFLQKKKKDFFQLRAKDFSQYEIWLEQQGLKTNTKRRKLITAKALVRYAVSRKKMSGERITFFRPPNRHERLPWIPGKEVYDKVFNSIEAEKVPIGKRNRLLVAMISELALQAAELCSLRWEHIQGKTLDLKTKKGRSLTLSSHLQDLLKDWKKQNHKGDYIFPGFNRHGIRTAKMTPRGLEKIFSLLAKQNNFPELKPKTLRHYAILQWLEAKTPETEIRRRLGVTSTYSLKPYLKVYENRSSS
ncbi:MAG: tyrosine-type recombinase/integrase [Oligoflexia bacterium]|nr:tyrosine-type recombinase/integrase [Oligoflexia bacterium]